MHYIEKEKPDMEIKDIAILVGLFLLVVVIGLLLYNMMNQQPKTLGERIAEKVNNAAI